MLDIRLETLDGAEYTLPGLVRWELEYTGGVPCDSMTAVCLYAVSDTHLTRPTNRLVRVWCDRA